MAIVKPLLYIAFSLRDQVLSIRCKHPRLLPNDVIRRVSLPKRNILEAMGKEAKDKQRSRAVAMPETIYLLVFLSKSHLLASVFSQLFNILSPWQL